MNKKYFKRLALLPILAFTNYTLANEKAATLAGASITSNIVYGQAVNNQGIQQNLRMDVYTPNTTQTQNPLIVFIHGGSFIQGSKEDVAAYCHYFAQKGFTAATISYRLGWNTGTTGNVCDGDPESLKQAGYRAIQDARAALRFLVANASLYKIDPAKVFLAGESAGATTALAAAYMDQAECDAFLPNVSQLLGSLDASGNNLSTTFSVKGIINMWGGLLDLSVVDAEEKIPVLSFHGTADKVTPYQVGPFNECPTFMQVYGSKPIYDLLLDRNVNTVLHANPNGGHGVYTFEYRAENMLCFTSRLLRNETVSGFYENFQDDCTPISLPVRFHSFNVQEEQSTVQLTWQTVEEQNSQHYLVERSHNGRLFTPIATINSKEGSDVNTYSYRDQAPLAGKSYYRLKQVDRDGSYTFSPVRSILRFLHQKLLILRQRQGLMIYYRGEGQRSYSLFDMKGNLVEKGVMTGNTCTISGLPAGLYIFNIQAGASTISKQVVVTQ